MVDSGVNWPAAGSHCHNLSGGADIDEVAVADGAAVTTQTITNDVKGSTKISVIVREDNTGACDGNVYISVLPSDGDEDGDSFLVGPTTGPVYTDPVWGPTIDPVQNTSRTATFAIMGIQHSKFRIHALNDSGQELHVTINQEQSSIPLAS